MICMYVYIYGQSIWQINRRRQMDCGIIVPHNCIKVLLHAFKCWTLVPDNDWENRVGYNKQWTFWYLYATRNNVKIIEILAIQQVKKSSLSQGEHKYILLHIILFYHAQRCLEIQISLYSTYNKIGFWP